MHKLPYLRPLVIAVSTALFLLMFGTLPWVVNSVAPYDDGLYIHTAASIVEGQWLGPYHSITLAKPPGFSLYIAASYFTGLPFGLSIAALHLLAALALGLAIEKVTASKWLGVLAAIFVLWNPQSFAVERVLRETVYSAQTLLIVAAVILAGTSKKLLPECLWWVVAGAVVGWFWVTREEGIWLLPGLALLLLSSAYSPKRFLRGAVMVTAASLVMPLAISGLNDSYYGRPIVAELNAPEQTRALSLMQSVLAGESIDSVPVSRAAMSAIASVSPAFRALAPSYADPNFWNNNTCLTPGDVTCGEIKGGWFHWSLREAIRRVGGYESPRTAEAYYLKLGDEIEAGCNEGRLQCSQRLIERLPNVSLPQLVQLIPYTYRALRVALFVDPIDIGAWPSVGPQDQLGAALSILNRPTAYKSEEYPLPFLESVDSARASINRSARRLAASAYGYAIQIGSVVALVLLMTGLKKRGLARPSQAALIAVSIFVMALSRLGIVGLVDITSFGAANLVYLGPFCQLLAISIMLALYLGFVRTMGTSRQKDATPLV